MNDEPLQALYLHIPFCIRKCTYCDFYSRPGTPEEMDAYARRLAEAIRLWGEAFHETPLDTVYIGGGTPSLLNEWQLELILRALWDNWLIPPEVEITLEANPATLSAAKARSFRKMGVNRVSMGVQSFNPAELAVLGRQHGVPEVYQAVRDIEAAGFPHFNLDLIYGVPGQTMESWAQSLKEAAALNPDHISAYLLQMDPSVPLARRIARGEAEEPADDVAADMFYRAHDYLAGKGYGHYEISNFALFGGQCRHNRHYWQSHPYLGLGAGAVSFLNGRRFLLAPDFKRFMTEDLTLQQVHAEVLEELKTPRDWLADALIMGLRLMEGVSLPELYDRFGLDPEADFFGDAIFQSLTDGLLEIADGRLRLTRRGWFLTNQVFMNFV